MQMNTIVFEKPFTHLTVIIKKARIYIDKCQPAITLTQICYQAIGFVTNNAFLTWWIISVLGFVRRYLGIKTWN